MNPEKILTIIGGGSAYMPGFIKAMLVKKQAFAGWRVVLYDIDLGNLDLIGRLARKMARAAGADIEFTIEADRRKALHKADFILISFRAGGFEMRLVDETIPLKYGIIGHETVGPGGFFYALRTVPVIKEIAAEIEEICPQALILNYTNPTNIITDAAVRHTGVKIYGLCDQVPHDAFVFARLLGRPDAEIEIRTIGLNHANWGVFFHLDGEDALPLVVARAGEILDKKTLSEEERLQVELAARTGLIPSKYIQYYYYRKRTLRRAQAAGKVRSKQILQELPEIFKHLRQQARAETPNVVRHRGGKDFGDFAVDILAALAGFGDAMKPLNVKNECMIDDLEEGLVVEVSCRIGKGSVEPLKMGRLPEEFAGLIRALGNYQRLAAEAAWAGTADEAILALAANPLVGDLDIAGRLYAEMSEACRAHLPERLLL